jgi:hypothetical protein
LAANLAPRIGLGGPHKSRGLGIEIGAECLCDEWRLSWRLRAGDSPRPSPSNAYQVDSEKQFISEENHCDPRHTVFPPQRPKGTLRTPKLSARAANYDRVASGNEDDLTIAG